MQGLGRLVPTPPGGESTPLHHDRYNSLLSARRALCAREFVRLCARLAGLSARPRQFGRRPRPGAGREANATPAVDVSLADLDHLDARDCGGARLCRDVGRRCLGPRRPRWSVSLGANPDELYGQTRGVVSSIAVDGDVAYAVSGACVAAAMQATTGRLLWRKQICSIARNDDTYASPVVARGLVLFGIDIMGDRPTDRGWLVALDAATGNERWRLYPERYSGTGTGISATPAIDAANDLGFVGTGNPTPRGAPPPGPDRYSESIIAFDLRSGSIRWAFGPVHEHDLLDRDLFASPNRFQTGSGAAKRWVIGEAGKDDTYYAVDERTGHELWRTDLGGSPTAQVIGTSAYADGRLFVPIYDDARGWIVALSATNGAILWRRTLRAGGYEAPVVWGNVVFVTNIRGELFGFDARNGRLLLERHVGTRCAGRGPSAVGSALYVASLDTLTQYTIIPR